MSIGKQPIPSPVPLLLHQNLAVDGELHITAHRLEGFLLFHKRKNECLINVLSSSLPQDEPAGSLSARLMGHSGHRAPTLLGSTLPFLRWSAPTTAACLWLHCHFDWYG